MIVEGELRRALDAFPLELSEIIATRRVVAGPDLFAEIVVPKQDLRRACEVQARGHVLHLREGYIEAAGDSKKIAALVSAAMPPFRALVKNVARLDGISPKALVTQLDLDNFEKGFPEALRAAERIVEYVDRGSTDEPRRDRVGVGDVTLACCHCSHLSRRLTRSRCRRS